MTNRWKVLAVLAGMTCALVACGDDYDPNSDDPVEQTGKDTDVTPGTASLRLNNRTKSFVLSGLYVALASGSSWGQNQLGSKTVRPGENFLLKSIPCNQALNLRFVGSTGDDAKQTGVRLDCNKVTEFDFNDK